MSGPNLYQATVADLRNCRAMIAALTLALGDSVDGVSSLRLTAEQLDAAAGCLLHTDFRVGSGEIVLTVVKP